MESRGEPGHRSGVMSGQGPAERELWRLGRRCAAVLRTSIAVCAGILALVIAPADHAMPTLGAVVALNAWSIGYVMLMFRDSGTRLLVADACVVCAVCLTQRWTVPPEALHGSASWVVAVASIAVATWQWHTGSRAGGAAAAAVIVTYLISVAVTPAAWFVVAWLGVEAALSRGLYLLVRRGAREADRAMVEAEKTRREAAVAAARRADEREHLAAMHDTAAATMLAIGSGLVTGREPWLATQLATALDQVTGNAAAPHGQVDLVPLLGDLVRDSPVATDLSVTGTAPLPARVAVAICRAVREALRNVARHAGVDAAAVRLEHEPGRVVVEVADDGGGFQPELVPPHRRGISLSIVERMVTVGGCASVTSSAGLGTRVRLEWPHG